MVGLALILSLARTHIYTYTPIDQRSPDNTRCTDTKCFVLAFQHQSSYEMGHILLRSERAVEERRIQENADWLWLSEPQEILAAEEYLQQEEQRRLLQANRATTDSRRENPQQNVAFSAERSSRPTENA